MNAILAITIGGLYAIAFYLLLRRSMMKMLLGMVVFGQAVNLLIFVAAGLTRHVAPFVEEDATAPPMPHADPLPQALILTAIVIGFGILAFAIALFHRAYKELKTDDSDALCDTV